MLVYKILDKCFPNSFVAKASAAMCAAALVPSAIWAIALSGAPYFPLAWNPWQISTLATFVWMIGCILATRSLLRPLALADCFLETLEQNGQKLTLPLSFRDEMGRLMQAIHSVPTHRSHRTRAVLTSKHVDALTGLMTRQGILEAIPHIPTGSIFLLRIDSLRSEKNGFSNEDEEELTKDIAEAIRKNVRMDDMVARWDECAFLCWLPRTDRHSSARIAERMVSQIQRVVHAETCTAEISLGYSTGDGTRSTEELLLMARIANQDATVQKLNLVSECTSTRGGIQIKNYRRMSPFTAKLAHCRPTRNGTLSSPLCLGH